MKQLSLVFAGTPDFAKVHLQALYEQGYTIKGVFTQPDRPAGRGRQLQASAVKKYALEQGLSVYQPESLRKTPQAHQILQSLNCDLLIVVAYGLILPQDFLAIPRLGAWNVHGSILPRWRGAAPIQRAMMAGDAETGITIMQMDAGLDTGDMLLKAHCLIMQNDTGGSLHDKLAELGAKTLLRALDRHQDLIPETQDDQLSCYAKKLSKEEAVINWQHDAIDIDRHIRAFNPWPVCQSFIHDQKIRIWQATLIQQQHESQPGEILAIDKQGITVAAAKDVLQLTHIQLPGKKVLSVADLINGKQLNFQVGDCFA